MSTTDCIRAATWDRPDPEETVTCYICGCDEPRSIPSDEAAPRLVRYLRHVEAGGRLRLRWARVIACWNCRETWADRVQPIHGKPEEADSGR